MEKHLSTEAKITWCPGCPNAQILVAFREALTELATNSLLRTEDVVIASGIGCHGKITDYANVNSFTSLHGRLVPTLTGVKLANTKLTAAGFSGDGDSYDEGLNHLIHAARRNSNISIFIHNNQVFGLTAGQATPTTFKGFKGRSTPEGSFEEPLNPLFLMLSAGATFVARSYALDIKRTKDIMKAALLHRGFSFVDIIQPCLIFNDTRDYYKDHVYWLPEDFPKDDFETALVKSREIGDKLPFGIFYQTERPTFEEIV